MPPEYEQHPDHDNEETIESTQPNTSKPKRSLRSWFAGIAATITVLVAVVVVAAWQGLNYFSQPPRDFPVGEHVTIPQGTNVKAITEQLADANVIRSKSLLYYLLVLRHDPTDIKASTYLFTEPLTAFEVATRLTEGDFASDLLRITFIEGERAYDYAIEGEEILSNFSREEYLRLATPVEGRLFPDTYFIPERFTAEDLLELQLETFEEQVAQYESLITNSSFTINEIVTLASIVEREANTPESMKMVAGILQNRLEIDMPLQADATIEYVLDVPLNELPEGQLATELRERDTPYNTYLYTGLPPTPIGNPGLTAIEAVLEPTPSEYFYYITGNDGEFYYAETLDQHNQNIARYLR